MRRKIVPYDPRLKERARYLRQHMTRAEVLVWQQLKARQMEGHDFDRQRPIDAYIVDFFCKDLMLAIEVDGVTHDTEAGQQNDRRRQKRLEALGVRFLRFQDEAVKQNLDGVLTVIREWIRERGAAGGKASGAASGVPETPGANPPRPVGPPLPGGEKTPPPRPRPGGEKALAPSPSPPRRGAAIAAGWVAPARTRPANHRGQTHPGPSGHPSQEGKEHHRLSHDQEGKSTARPASEGGRRLGRALRPALIPTLLAGWLTAAAGCAVLPIAVERGLPVTGMALDGLEETHDRLADWQTYYRRNVAAVADRRPVAVHGATGAAYQRWVSDEVRELPSVSQTIAIGGGDS